MMCAPCPWNKDINTELFNYLLKKLRMQDAGCPLDRHELSNENWELLALFIDVRNRWFQKNAELKAEEERVKNGNG